jgi:Lanthionine synthetase C-like protein/HopA1 effector protein family
VSAVTGYSSELVPAIRALSMTFPDRLSWLGDRIEAGAGAAPDAGRALIDQLSSVLYSQFYCYGRPVPFPAHHPGRQALATHSFVKSLRRANAFRSEGAGQSDAVCSAESLSASPGFFVMRSPESSQEQGVRLYWNTTPEAAVVLVRRITRLFRRAGAACQLKILISLSQGERADSGVLYLGREELTRLAPALSGVYRALRRYMRAATPAFTLRIAPGLALAESLPDGESFGRDRCSLVAQALVGIAESGHRISEGSLEAIAQHFASRGLSLDRPYLGAGSHHHYALPIQTRMAFPAARPNESSGRDAFLQAALRIGHHLARSAIWSGDRCNWVADLTGPRRGYGALDPMLYSGTCGIAWFLAELYRVTGDAAFRRTAHAALEQSCRTVEGSTGRYGRGLYGGAAGVAYVAWRCARVLDRPALLRHSRRIFRRLVDEPGGPEADVISGDAGLILALAAARIHQDRMERLARGLLASAKQTWNALSWRTINRRRSPDLTGFSHGTAGIAAALLVAYEQTRQHEFRTAAAGAIQYERACFSEADRNWPDYRSARNRRSLPSYTVAWCHGAPGIALSRALAVEVCGPDSGYQDDLAAALDTTRAAVESSSPGTSFCLCHGVAGNADVLLLLGGPEDQTIARRAAASSIANCDPGKRNGAFSEKPPGLMSGWAGIGQFYLRVADPNVPSPLWIGAELSPRKKGHADAITVPVA